MPEDRIAYCQKHKVFELIASMNAKEGDKKDSKTVSKAIGLKVSRPRDYQQLVDEGIFEIEGEYKNRNIRLKRKGEKDKN